MSNPVTPTLDQVAILFLQKLGGFVDRGVNAAVEMTPQLIEGVGYTLQVKAIATIGIGFLISLVMLGFYIFTLWWLSKRRAGVVGRTFEDNEIRGGYTAGMVCVSIVHVSFQLITGFNSWFVPSVWVSAVDGKLALIQYGLQLLAK